MFQICHYMINKSFIENVTLNIHITKLLVKNLQNNVTPCYLRGTQRVFIQFYLFYFIKNETLMASHVTDGSRYPQGAVSSVHLARKLLFQDSPGEHCSPRQRPGHHMWLTHLCHSVPDPGLTATGPQAPAGRQSSLPAPQP